MQFKHFGNLLTYFGSVTYPLYSNPLSINSRISSTIWFSGWNGVAGGDGICEWASVRNGAGVFFLDGILILVGFGGGSVVILVGKMGCSLVELQN